MEDAAFLEETPDGLIGAGITLQEGKKGRGGEFVDDAAVSVGANDGGISWSAVQDGNLAEEVAWAEFSDLAIIGADDVEVPVFNGEN